MSKAKLSVSQHGVAGTSYKFSEPVSRDVADAMIAAHKGEGKSSAKSDAKKAAKLYYAMGPNCWGKGFTSDEAIKNAKANWPRSYMGVKRPQPKHFSVWEIESMGDLIGFADIGVSDFDGGFTYPKSCVTRKLQTSVMAKAD